jgi:hypothetical protein
MKVRIFTILILLIFSVTASFAMDDRQDIINSIATSINDHPEYWLDTGGRFVYCKNPDEMKKLKTRTWPDQDSNLFLTYSLYKVIYYVCIEKPFEYRFKGKEMKKVMTAIKLYKLKVLQKEVGHLLKKKRSSSKEIKKKEIVEKGGLKKL